MKIVIKRTSNEEIVRSLHKKTFPSDEFYESKKNVYWLAIAKYSTKEDEVVGFAVATELDHGILFLSRAGIIWKARGKGLQKRLIRVRTNYARKNNFKQAITYTSVDNISSFLNLLRCKFMPYIPEYCYAGVNVIYLMRDLG